MSDTPQWAVPTACLVFNDWWESVEEGDYSGCHEKEKIFLDHLPDCELCQGEIEKIIATVGGMAEGFKGFARAFAMATEPVVRALRTFMKEHGDAIKPVSEERDLVH